MKERDFAIDFLKTAAIIAVVIIHVTTAYLDRARVLSFSFDTYLILNGVTRFAVPLFFLSSGLLLGAKYVTVPSITSFYKKRILRILPPYLFWTVIYYLLFSSVFAIFRWSFINNLLTGNTSYQFYFIPTICVLYLLFPLFIKYRKIFLNKQFIILFFIFECILLYFVYYYQYKIPLYSPLRNALINMSPFLIGIFISEHYAKVKRFLRQHIMLSIDIAALTGFVICLESLLLFFNLDNTKYIRDQWRPSVLVYALAAGAVLYNIYEVKFHKWNNTILWLSKYSFGVFFIHVALMYPLLLVIDAYHIYGILSFLVFLALTISGSYLIIYAASHIPKVGRIISAS